MSSENKTATIFLNKKEFTHKADKFAKDGKTVVKKAGTKDHFYTGNIFISGRKYDVTFNGIIYEGKGDKPAYLTINVKESGKGTNHL